MAVPKAARWVRPPWAGVQHPPGQHIPDARPCWQKASLEVFALSRRPPTHVPTSFRPCVGLQGEHNAPSGQNIIVVAPRGRGGGKGRAGWGRKWLDVATAESDREEARLSDGAGGVAQGTGAHLDWKRLPGVCPATARVPQSPMPQSGRLGPGSVEQLFNLGCLEQIQPDASVSRRRRRRRRQRRGDGAGSQRAVAARSQAPLQG